MVDIRASCYAALLAAFSCPQKHCKALIFRGALKLIPTEQTRRFVASLTAEIGSFDQS
jgi:hypothetical protein